MVFFSSFLGSIFFVLTPLFSGALLVPVLCQGVFVSFSKFFLATQLFLSFLNRPIVNVAISGLPILLFLAFTPTFVLSSFGLFWFFLLGNLFQNALISVEILIDTYQENNPFLISKNIQGSATEISVTLKEFLNRANFREMFQNVNPLPGSPVGYSYSTHYTREAENPFDNYNFSEAIRNLTISESTQQYIDAVNAAVIGLLENIEVSDVFNTSRIPPSLYTSLDDVAEELHNLADYLNFTKMIRKAAVPPDVQDSLSNLQVAFTKSVQKLNLTELFVSGLTTEESLSKFRPWPPLLPRKVLQSYGIPHESTSWKGTILAFFRWLPPSFYIIAGFYIFLLIFGIPCIFILRAALQEGSQWLLTHRYEFEIPSEQRSASGWMLVAATSGLVSGVSEVFPYCCFYLYLYSSQLLSAESVVVLIAHTLTAVPLRGVSQMRLAETSARRDVLKESKPGLISAFFLTAVANGIFNLWWLYFSATIMISLITLWVPTFFVMIDALVFGSAVLWGRRICQRLLKDEKRFTEDRERKRD